MKKLQEVYPALRSSNDPFDLSLTIKGFLISLLPLFLFLLKKQGVEIAEADLIVWLGHFSELVALVFVCVGGIRRIYYASKK